MSAFFDRVRAALAPKGYDVLRELGSGGMGIVVLARHLKLDRLVAVKVIRPEMHTAGAAERFLVEAKTLAILPHPNMFPVSDAAETVGLPSSTNTTCSGESSANGSRRAPRPSDEA